MFGSRLPIFFCVLILLGPACRGSTSMEASTKQEKTSATANGEGNDGSSVSENTDSSKSDRGSLDDRSATDIGNAGTSESGGMDVQIQVARCLERGRPASATIKAEPAALVGVAVEYEGYSEHADWGSGVTSVNGTYKWVWAIPQNVPIGSAVIVALAQSADATESGHARSRFQVARPGGCQ